MTAAPAERPRDLNALISETIAGYQRGFPVLVFLGVLPSLPNLVYQLLAGPSTARLTSPTFHPHSTGDLTALITPLFIAGGSLSFLLTVLAAPFLFGAVYAAAVDVVEGRPPSVESALRACASAYASLWGLLFVVFATIFGLAITCIGIPFAIYIGVRWALALPAFFSERRGGMAALGTSWEIVRFNWWRTLGLLLLVGLSVGIVSGVIGGIAGAGSLVMPEALRPIPQAIVAAVVSAFLSPITVLFTTLLYFDLRARRLALARA